MGQIARHPHSSLHTANKDEWRRLRRYSFALAEALQCAYGEIYNAPTSTDGYLQAYVRLKPFREQIVCDEQRLRLEYALALAYTGEDALPQALDCLISALTIAERLYDFGAQVELGYLAGAILTMLSQYPDAYQLYHEARETLRGLAQDGALPDPVFELNITIRMAGCVWELGQFSVCQRHLDEAFALRATEAPDAALEAATLAWMDAQLARVLGRPAQAYSQATAAAEGFHDLDQPLNAARSQIIAAECALDLTQAKGLHTSGILPQSLSPRVSPPLVRHGEAFSSERLRDILRQAGVAAKRGRTLARELNDEGGVGMARLAQRRYDRAVGREGSPEKGIAQIEAVIRTARRIGDMSLHGRALTALGEELVLAGRLEAARVIYERARLVLEEHELGGLAFWPRSALIQGGL